jgi:hypothetical protein
MSVDDHGGLRWFTLAQTGMVRHWHAEHQPGWMRRAAINGLGAVLTRTGRWGRRSSGTCASWRVRTRAGGWSC